MTTYTLFSQAAETVNTAGATTGGSIGVEFSVSQACTLNALWLYSPSGWSLTALPTTIALYTVSGSSLVVSQTSVTWSGAAASGWVRAAFTSPPALTASTNYMATAFHGSGSAWFVYNSSSWSSSITNGPLSAGTSQGWYSTTASAVAYPSSQLSSSNWYLDVEVTPTAVTSTGSASLATMAAHATAAEAIGSTGGVSLAAMTAHGSGAETITGSGSVSLARMGATGSGGALTGVTSTGSVALSSMSAAGSGVTAATVVSGTVGGGTLGASGSALVALSHLNLAGSAAGGVTRVRGVLVVGEPVPPPPALLQPPVVNNWLSGNALDAPSLNTYVRDTFMYLANPPLLRVQQNAVQPEIPTAQWTVVTLQQVTEDTYSGWSADWNIGNAYQTQVPGWYSLTLNVSADVSSGHLGRVGFWYWSAANGVYVGPVEFGQQVVGPGVSSWTWHAYDESYLQVDDLVLPMFYHQAGVSVNTDLSSPSTFELTWISS